MTAYIWRLSGCEAPWVWALAFDYDADLVEAIKAYVPSRQRKWCPDRKEWWFRAEAIEVAALLARQHCGDVVHSAPPRRLSAETAAAYRALHLLPSAPDELVKAAYRILAKQCHPDMGGSTQEMQRVNEAYGVLAARSKA